MITGSTDCWVTQFMHAMIHIGFISHEDMSVCKSVDDYIALAISKAESKVKMQSLWHGMCQEVWVPRLTPDTLPSR
jgi:hypothetical protein